MCLALSYMDMDISAGVCVRRRWTSSLRRRTLQARPSLLGLRSRRARRGAASAPRTTSASPGDVPSAVDGRFVRKIRIVYACLHRVHHMSSQPPTFNMWRLTTLVAFIQARRRRRRRRHGARRQEGRRRRRRRRRRGEQEGAQGAGEGVGASRERVRSPPLKNLTLTLALTPQQRKPLADTRCSVD